MNAYLIDTQTHNEEEEIEKNSKVSLVKIKYIHLLFLYCLVPQQQQQQQPDTYNNKIIIIEYKEE